MALVEIHGCPQQTNVGVDEVVHVALAEVVGNGVLIDLDGNDHKVRDSRPLQQPHFGNEHHVLHPAGLLLGLGLPVRWLRGDG